ncbi:MAG: non-canonical purine NTP pyrophosphatase [Candidatus Roizmanbacteria bacterium]|nr:non-canonical purine NTP pyrophosphatase [Candidatus Roizmanbacteria bacterium]
MDLLIATHNPAKKQELRTGFASLISSKINLVSLNDLGITEDPEETGKTFLENAQLKAEYFAKLTNLPTVADDGGIEIDALNGEPGIHSKRWLGKTASDSELIQYTLSRLANTPPEKRTAHFRIVLYYVNPLHDNFFSSSTASLDGSIASHIGPRALRGFPYRALFIVDKYKKYYDELTEQEHRDANHRLKAVEKLIPFIKEDLLQ